MSHPKIPDSVNYCDPSNLKCKSASQQWPADPDIAGIGVIAAFCATSVITLIAVIIGYFCGWIQDEQNGGLLNELDFRVIRVIESISGRNVRNSQMNKGPWRDALERFVLSLSDQQLVTGISILLLGYIQHCSMSSFHFIVIVTLAWFSSTTHLSTLSVLYHHLNKYPTLKYIRIFGMLILLIHPSFQSPKKLDDSIRRQDNCVKKLKYLDGCNLPDIVEKALRSFIVFNYINLEFIDSFLWQICWMLFGNVYGIRQVLWARQVVGRAVIRYPKGAEDDLTFGQLIALLLLALPLLAAFEAFAEAKKLQSPKTSTPDQIPQRSVPNTDQNDDSEEYSNDPQHIPDNVQLISPEISVAPSPAPGRQSTGRMQRENLVPSEDRHYFLNHQNAAALITRPVELTSAALVVYTLVTLLVLAYYIAWTFKHHEAGVKASLAMAGILFVAALVSYIFTLWDWVKDRDLKPAQSSPARMIQ
ncbi:hypothetical protein EV356DRAFT_562654 [Viridothelium virens]|uniref:Uncharacterized protein n=1 Tax=Viridothelium virens TaxID=1048519 RepID=A0A6A6HP52_VIRVR|nr:hypothetical protein EV356DRAFT_562654 [Viridothelium virens]